jgi:hypothetical protein
VEARHISAGFAARDDAFSEFFALASIELFTENNLEMP